MINILLTGIGGQGTVLAAKLLAAAAISHKWQVRSAETIGMSQRGGSVISHVRIANTKAGESVQSALVPAGQAALIVAFEPIEAARVLPYLAPCGTLVSATSEILPVSAALSGSEYSSANVIANIKESLRQTPAPKTQATDMQPAPAQASTCAPLHSAAHAATNAATHYVPSHASTQAPSPKFIPVNDAEILQQVGNARVLNTALLAIALNSGAIPITLDDLRDAVRACVKPQYIDVNLRAIDVALQFVKQQ